MSNKIRAVLKKLGLLNQTSHDERLELDRQIEQRTGENCDDALEKHMISEHEVHELILQILKRKKKQEMLVVV